MKRAFVHHDTVLRFLQQFTGSPADASELASDVLVRFRKYGVKELKSYDDESIRAYLIRTARRLAFDWRQKRQKSRVEYRPEFLPHELIDPEDTPEHRVIADELLSMLQQEIQHMPETRRQICELWIEGMKTPDIAIRLDSNLHTVKKHLSLALAQLRAVVEMHGGAT